MVYGFFRWIFATALSVYYRWTLTQGAIPSDGPLVICGNHPNGLIDPVAVMRLTQRPVRFMAKAPIFKMPVLGWIVKGMKCLPVYRKQDDPSQMGKNDETFKAAHAALAEGDCICIFPEGRSHSDPGMSPLKTGAARIALGAESEKGFSLGVKFVPVGLVYRRKGVFRSEVAVSVGEPIAAASMREEFERDPVAASKALTEKLDAALHTVTVNLDTWEDLPLIEAASRLYKAERKTPGDLRPYAAGLSALRERDPERLESVRRRVLTFDGYLHALRLPADELDHVRPFRALRFVTVHVLRVLLGIAPALVGVLAYVIPYQLIRALVALVKLEEDIRSSVKLGVGVLLFPAWTALLTWLLWRELGTPGLLDAAALPFCGLFALAFIESEKAALADARAYLALRTHGSLRDRLLERRKALVDELEQLGKETGVLEASANG